MKCAFAYINKPVGKNDEAVASLLADHPQVVVDQVKCEFTPYATAIHKDQQVVFKSSDPVGHNVHTHQFSGNAMNEMVPPGRNSRPRLPPTGCP